MVRYSGDPYWLNAKYPGQCKGCGKPFKKGDRVFRYKDGSVYADECADKAYSDFMAAKQDEEFYNREY